MKLKRGDLVTRKSYNHDTVFKITNIKNDIYYLYDKDRARELLDTGYVKIEKIKEGK